MATTEVFYDGDGSDVTFDIPFEYLEESDVKVSVGGTLKTQDTDYTFSTLTEITFTTAPPSGTANVRIFRDTDIESLRNEFFAGSAIRAQDLNDDFLQTLYTVQEIEDQFVTQTNGSFDSNVDMNSNRITELADPVDAQDAVTKQYLEDNYFDDGTETITSSETWTGNDTTIATTLAVDNRVDSKIDTAITNDIGADSSGITVTDDGDGTITLGLGANSIDLDRIKNADIITSAESNPNNDTTIATTAKIDDMIDAAITGDIAVDSTGLTLTNDGDGTITLGIGAGSVDLDRISAGDIITYAEQNAGSSPDDDSIFTSSAASRRFDTLVQTGTPSGSDWELGKTWLQNDDDQTLKVWNGSTWLDVASGGSFRTQDKVIYVDSTGGDDSKTGHRISGPKLTIKAAINDINADISTSIKTAGSGYANGSYSNVPLTGGTSGSGLQADITVSGGSVTACTVTSTTTLEDYQIGDILSAADSNLGSGGGSGFELEVTGGGDGMTVIVAAGDYEEAAPIQIKRRNVSIIGMALRSTIVHPSAATQGDHADGNNALFELNSGSFLQNLTLTGMQAGTYSSGDPNTLDPDLPKRQGWNFAFYNNAVITKSPYIQNCTNFSDSQIVNTSSFNPHNPAGGQGGDLTNEPTGGGLLVDGAVPHTSSPLRSMVCDSYTHVGLNGPGILVTNNGYLQATSSYAFFNKYHIKARNGGQANLAASTTDFGEKALVADGKSTSAIFTASVNGAKTSGSETFDIDNIAAGSGWFGDANIPATNMLVTVNSVTYPILEATAITGGYRVKISRPNASNRSLNDGLNGDIADDAAVSFFLRSQIASSGHTMEYVGSGMDYDALPENGGVPDETKQITELNDGKIWTAITDHNGKFKIGGNQTDDPIFEVDQQLGFITIPTGSIAFDLLSDTTPQLGGDLDVNDFKITSAGDGNVHIGPHGTGKIRVDAAIITASDNNITLDPHGNGQVDVSSHKIINLADPTSAQDAATKNYVDTQIGGIDEVVEDLTPQLGGDLDVNGQTITSASNGNIVIDPNGTGVIELGSNVGVGTASPEGNIHIESGSSGSTSGPNANADELVIENSGNAGLTFITPNTSNARINFSDPQHQQAGMILYDHSTNNLQFNVNAAEAARIDYTGRVGIGTSTPGNYHPSYDNLVVGSTSTDSGVTIFSSTTGTGGLIFADGTSANDRIRSSITYSHANDLLNFSVNSGQSALVIDSSKRVGIGTTSPLTRLHVQSGSSGASSSTAGSFLTVESNGTSAVQLLSGNAYSNYIYFGDNDDTDVGYIQYSHGADALIFGTNAQQRARIDSSGRLGLGTSSPNATLHVNQAAGSEIRIDTIGGANTDSTLSFYEQNIDRARIYWDGLDNDLYLETTIGDFCMNPQGNVGIGTTSPSTALHVVKDENNSSSYYLDGNTTLLVSNNNGSGIPSLKLSGSSATTAAIVWGGSGSESLILTNRQNERLRIDSSGRLLVGTSTASGTAPLQVNGAISTVERTITASAFDLGTGNFWTCGAIAIPNPTNGVAGMSGLIRVTAAPTSFGSNWDFPGGTYTAPTAFPAVAPFYVVNSTTFLLGNWTEGIA